jgi:hypothetical protein
MDEAGRVTEGSTQVTGLLTAEESAVLSGDGALMIARLDPFRVERRTRAGVWTPSYNLPVAAIPMTDRERRAYETRNGGRAREPGLYPRFIPPFTLGPRALLPTPKGFLVIRRTRSADYAGTHYWVVGADNRLRGEINLTVSERIALVTARWMYVVREDSDGESHLERRALPLVLQ